METVCSDLIEAILKSDSDSAIAIDKNADRITVSSLGKYIISLCIEEA